MNQSGIFVANGLSNSTSCNLVARPQSFVNYGGIGILGRDSGGLVSVLFK